MRIAGVLEVHAREQAPGGGLSRYLAGILHAHGNRLLTHHVQPALKALQGVQVVEVVRAGDDHGLHVHRLQHRGHVRVDGHAPLLAALHRLGLAVLVALGRSHQFVAWQVMHGATVVRTDTTNTHQGGADWLH